MNELAHVESPTMSIAATPRNLPSQMAGAQALVQRTLAEVQVAVMMAKQFPRDKIDAKEKLLTDCCREGLAMAAMYSYSKGGTEITGPSIRLAEAAKNAWGNMQSGWRELSRGTANGVNFSEVEAFAWDTENNTRASVVFTVRHWRDTRQGGYALKEEREIYELCANQAARRERACILKMIDGDMIEEAVKQCSVTLSNNIQITPERIGNMVKMFEDIGVKKEQIEKRIQRRMDAINGPLMFSLTKIYNSIKDGMSKPEDWFEAEKTGDDSVKTKTDQVKENLKKKLDPEVIAKHQQEDVANGSLESYDPETGEILETASERPPALKTLVLDTLADAQRAGGTLVDVLKAVGEQDRPSAFVNASGPEIVDALRKHGDGLTIKKIRDLGIALPESEAA